MHVVIVIMTIIKVLAISMGTTSNISVTHETSKTVIKNKTHLVKSKKQVLKQYGYGKTDSNKFVKGKLFEEVEFQQLEKKWNARGTKSVNKTIDSIPKNWLLSTGNHNITFNLTEAKTQVAEKLASLIQKHLIQNRSQKQDQLSADSTRRQKQHQEVMEISLKDKVTEIREEISDKVNNKRVTENTKDTLEYPGKNQTARNQLFEQWQVYYQCLQNNLNFIPKAHYVFPGEAIKMNCQTCLNPGGETRIQWSLSTVRTKNVQKDLDPAKKKTIFNSNNRIVVDDKGHSLHLYGVNEKDAGNYSCSVSKTLMTLHLLQVAERNENITRVWPDTSRRRPQAVPEITLQNFSLRVFTKWRNWTACSVCSRIGKRFRVGVCTVAATKRANAPKILSLFKEGIPCRSKLLPQSVQNHPNVLSRKSEIMEAFCKEPCPMKGKYVVRNEKGQVVEEADNSKGVYSMRQKLPKLPLPIKRKIMFLKQWDTASIQCPGSILSDIPTRWFINNQPIFSNGDRIYVTPSHTLIVEDLGLSDSQLYSCWQGSKLVGTVRLVVTQPIRLTFSPQISALSMMLIVSTFVIIFGRAFCNALRQDK